MKEPYILVITISVSLFVASFITHAAQLLTGN